jgi:hypothetical protein
MKGLKTYLIGSAVVLVVYLVAQYYKPKPTDWTPSYLKEDKIPFGLYILNKEIRTLFPGGVMKTSRQPLYNTLKDQNYLGANYLIICGSLKMDQLDYKELTRYLYKGNNVFIATFDLGKALKERLKLRTATVFEPTVRKSPAINFVSPGLKASKPYVFDKGLGNQYFSRFDTARVIVLGRNQSGDANFIKYSFGKGSLYILPNPQLLSNYNLINPSGADYAAKALSFLPPAKLLIWDEYQTRGNTEDASILRVIFKHAPLRWAYYIALVSILLFVLFEVKRRQRVIPVIAPLLNSSVDFAKVVGKVYYQQRDNKDLAGKKISYLLEFIRTSYRLKTSSLDEEFMTDLARKSGAAEETVLQLITLIKSIDKGYQVSDAQLISLNKQTEHFYKQAQ